MANGVTCFRAMRGVERRQELTKFQGHGPMLVVSEEGLDDPSSDPVLAWALHAGAFPGPGRVPCKAVGVMWGGGVYVGMLVLEQLITVTAGPDGRPPVVHIDPAKVIIGLREVAPDVDDDVLLSTHFAGPLQAK